MRLHPQPSHRLTGATRPGTVGIVLAAVLLLVGGLLLVAPDRAGAAVDTVISTGKPATASSVEGSSYGAQNAFDGNPATRWASVEGKDPQWIRVDLGASANVTRVSLNWEAAYAKTYRVEVSDDGTTWTRLANETAGNGGTDDWTGLSGKGRYLRVYGTARGTSYGYSLYGVEVYGNFGGTTTPTPTPTPTTTPTTPTGAFTVVAAATSPPSAPPRTAPAPTRRRPRSPSSSTRSSI
ncbi:discoidin domain-containing protein [Kitasatospora gansuensis]